MEKRKLMSKQIDLLARDPDRMQWQDLPVAIHHKTQCLLAELLLTLSSQAITAQTKECHHGCENSI